jgi:adenylate kinase
LSSDAVIANAVAALEKVAAYLERSPPAVTEEGEVVKEDEVAMEAARDAKARLDELEQSKSDNKGEYEVTQVLEWCKERVLTMSCQNQGYVVVGFPETADDAAQIFAASDEADDPDAPNPLTVPEYIFSLEAPDEVLMKRAMMLPPSETIEGSKFSEEGMRQALPAFRKANDEDREGADHTTVLNYFDFKEIHPTYKPPPPPRAHTPPAHTHIFSS